jgi:hypothetical protein
MREVWEYEALYRTDGHNPIYVFGAFKAFRKAGLPPPEWVCEALERMADNLEPLIARPPQKNIEAAAGAAMEFRSVTKGDNVFSRAKVEFETREWMAAYIEQRRSGLTDTAAQRVVAETKFSSPSTVRRRLNRFIDGTSFASPQALFEATVSLAGQQED